MSKRVGSLISMRELVKEVGVDVARFFFLMRRMDSHLDFDTDIALKQSEENPVYYVQYAHARICSILKYAKAQGAAPPSIEKIHLSLLKNREELDLIKKIASLPEVVHKAAASLEPHRLTAYLREVATSFHLFYHKHRVVTDNHNRTMARLALVEATRIALRNALKIIGVSAPTSM
jgi:arginyl-tRNA synthetase